MKTRAVTCFFFFLRADPAATLSDYWLFGAYVAKFVLLCSFLNGTGAKYACYCKLCPTVLVLLSRPGVPRKKKKKRKKFLISLVPTVSMKAEWTNGPMDRMITVHTINCSGGGCEFSCASLVIQHVVNTEYYKNETWQISPWRWC